MNGRPATSRRKLGGLPHNREAPSPLVHRGPGVGGTPTISTVPTTLDVTTVTPRPPLKSKPKPARKVLAAPAVHNHSSRTRLTITFHNVNGIALRDEEVVRAADAMAADIIGVGETLLRRARTLCTGSNGKSEYRWILGTDEEREGGGRARGGVAFLVSNKIGAAVTLAKTDRNQLWIRVKDKARSIFICSVYLPPAGSVHTQERQQTMRELSINARRFRNQGGAIIIGGDLNGRTGANGDPVTNAEGKELLQFSDDNGLRIINHDPKRSSGLFTWERKCGDELQRTTIDYALCSSSQYHLVKKLRIRDEPELRLGSDHKPLSLQLEWESARGTASIKPQATRTPCWNVDRATAEDWSTYREALTSRLKEWTAQDARLQKSGRTDQAIINHSTALFGLAIKKAAGESIGARYIYPRKYKPWIDEEVMTLIHQRDDFLALSQEEMRSNGGCTDQALLFREQYQQKCRMVRSTLRRKKRTHRSTLHRKVEQLQGKDLWKLLRSVFDRPSGFPEVIRRPEGTATGVHHEKMAEARRYFHQIGTDHHPYGTFNEGFAKAVRDKVSLQPEESRTVAIDAGLDTGIALEEVKGALLRLRTHKSPGADRIHNEMLTRGGDDLSTAIHRLFSHIWQSEAWPQQWQLGHIAMIHKGGAKENLDNYRGITLLSSLSKLFEVVVNSRLYVWANRGSKLRDEQGGFRPDRRCSDQMFLLHEIIMERREKGEATYCAFIDVRKAYDSVWRTGLWQSLWDLDLKGKMYRMLRSMFGTMQRRVLVEGDVSEMFNVETGVAQGAVTSPFLYSCFINGLLAELDASGLGVSVADVQIASLAYADDVALLAPSPENLTILLDIMTSYAHKWRFEYNARKSNVSVYGTKRQVEQADQEHFFLAGAEVAVVRDYKYLGCEMSGLVGRGGAVIDRLVRTARYKAADLSGPAGCRYGGVHVAKALKLWEAYARPVIEYGAEVWRPTKAQAKKLEGTVCEFARHVLGLDTRTGNDFLLSELGLLAPEARRQELKLRFFRHLCAAEPERALSRIFHHRCAEVQAGRAKKSLCAEYRDLLLKHGFAEEWETLPVAMPQWESRVRKAVAKRDVADRKERLATRESMVRYLTIKPMIKPSRSAYLYGRGLGVWLKLRLRADNLPLLSVLARTSRPRMSDHCARCALCDSGASENVAHFLTGCASFQLERDQLRGELHRAMQPLLAGCNLARLVADTARNTDDQALLRLLLDSHEEPTTDSGEERRQKRLAVAREETEVKRKVDRVARDYFVRIWHKRAALLGGVPALDSRGYKMVLGALRPDGRCASFVDVVRAK